MKILLVGATGFIGKKLGVELALAGHEIHVLTRSAKGVRRLLPFPCRIFEWDPENKRMAPSALDGVEVIINLAGTPVAGHRWNDVTKESILSSRLMSTMLLWSAIEKSDEHKVHTFINASAIGFYGETNDEWVDESSGVGEGFLAEVCDRWERTFFKGPDSIRKVAVRIGLVLGAGEGALKEILPLFNKGMGGNLGRGRQWMSWIHIEDLVRLFVSVIENKKIIGVVNAVSSQPVTNKIFTRVLAQTLGKPAIVNAPSLALKIGLGEMSELLLKGQRVSNQKIKSSSFLFNYEDLGLALKDLVGFMKDGTRVHETSQFLDYPLSQVFDFFSDEENLEKITPSHLNFHVLRKSTPQITEGTLIDYKLKIRGVPTNWQTEIVDWKPYEEFVDVQKKGPYALWHHTHTFKKMNSGTWIRDRVLYKLPMGVLGRLIAGSFVENDIKSIFKYRFDIMSQIFPDKKN